MLAFEKHPNSMHPFLRGSRLPTAFNWLFQIHPDTLETMTVMIHPHAFERMVERGATEEEVIATITGGERFPAKFGRIGFRRNFPFDGEWRGLHYATKQIEAYAVKEIGWMVITVLVKYF